MSSKLTRQDVQDILAILDSSTFDDLKIETDDFKISLRRNGAASSPPAPSAPSETKPARGIAAEAAGKLAPAQENSFEVKSPMFGAFYRSPRPGADPFVSIGSKVKADTIIGIIEVMKLMNPVLAGVAGEIVEAPVADGAVVEFDQVLMRVRRD